MPRMTTKQKELLQYLRSGGKLKSALRGWIDPRTTRTLQIVTQEALETTGELVEVLVGGRRFTNRYIVHESHELAKKEGARPCRR